MEDIPIGTAIVDYDEEGHAIAARFVPVLRVTDISKLEGGLVQHTAADKTAVERNAQTVMAEWFTHVETVEIWDREEREITSRVKSCLAWPNGKPKQCQIEFTLSTRKVKTP